MTDAPADSAALCCSSLVAAPLGPDEASQVAEVLKALADPVRLRIVSILACATDGEVCACDLPALLDRSQPTISHHLGLLRDAGLVDRDQRGRWAWFSLRRERLDELAGLLGQA